MDEYINFVALKIPVFLILALVYLLLLMACCFYYNFLMFILINVELF